jgi:hypothetical protein
LEGRLDFLYGFFLLLSDKERELGEAQVEIRALRLSERAREKAVEEVSPNCHILSCYHADYVVFNPLSDRKKSPPKRNCV